MAKWGLYQGKSVIIDVSRAPRKLYGSGPCNGKEEREDPLSARDRIRLVKFK
jgi:hypothetical protein